MMYCIATMLTAGMSDRAVISTYNHDVDMREDGVVIRGQALIPAVDIAAIKKQNDVKHLHPNIG